jgi:hypothetical protein
MFDEVVDLVGPVSFGSTTVGAEEAVAIVALKSGGGVLLGCFVAG